MAGLVTLGVSDVMTGVVGEYGGLGAYADGACAVDCAAGGEYDEDGAYADGACAIVGAADGA